MSGARATTSFCMQRASTGDDRFNASKLRVTFSCASSVHVLCASVCFDNVDRGDADDDGKRRMTQRMSDDVHTNASRARGLSHTITNKSHNNTKVKHSTHPRFAPSRIDDELQRGARQRHQRARRQRLRWSRALETAEIGADARDLRASVHHARL